MFSIINVYVIFPFSFTFSGHNPFVIKRLTLLSAETVSVALKGADIPPPVIYATFVIVAPTPNGAADVSAAS